MSHIQDSDINLILQDTLSVTRAAVITGTVMNITGNSILLDSSTLTATVLSITLTSNIDITGTTMLTATEFTVNTSNLSIGSLAQVSVNAGGYSGTSVTSGIGNGAGGGINTGGGGYGGKGCGVTAASSGIGIAYGSVMVPTDKGSAGGSSNVNAVAGGSGGGTIYIRSSVSLSVDGKLTSDGGSSTYSCGGGSGGSILVYTNSFSGHGLVSVNGGAGTSYGANYGGGGGGGRIAIYYANSTFGGALSAAGGVGAVSSCFGGPGIFLGRGWLFLIASLPYYFYFNIFSALSILSYRFQAPYSLRTQVGEKCFV